MNAARKTAMLVCALLVVPVMFAPYVDSLWVAVGLVSVAAAAHQGWSANLFTFSSDMFPRRAVGSVVGFGGMAGAVGGMLFTKITGYILEWNQQRLPAGVRHRGLRLPGGARRHPPARAGHQAGGAGLGRAEGLKARVQADSIE